jgi:hypothetical protein
MTNSILMNKSDIHLSSGMISLTAFKNKFWEAYTAYGREDVMKESQLKVDEL